MKRFVTIFSLVTFNIVTLLASSGLNCVIASDDFVAIASEISVDPEASAAPAVLADVEDSRSTDTSISVDSGIPISDPIIQTPVTLISPVLPTIQHPLLLLSPAEYETPQQRAARIKIRTYALTMKSVRQNLFWLKPPFAPSKWRPVLKVTRLFLSNPFSIPEGCVAIDRSAYPFNYAKVPGCAPFEYLYSPDRIPQCIRTEYDSATGTYLQIMVPWDEYQANVNRVNPDRPIPEQEPFCRFIK